MVNLKQYILDSTENEAALTDCFEVFRSYVCKPDVEFITKVTRATRDLFLDKKVSVLHKYFILQLTHLSLQLNVSQYIDSFAINIAPVLLKLIDNGEANKLTPDELKQVIFRGINADTQGSEDFYDLLVEGIEFWHANLKSESGVFDTLYKQACASGVTFAEEPRHVYRFLGLVGRRRYNEGFERENAPTDDSPNNKQTAVQSSGGTTPKVNQVSTPQSQKPLISIIDAGAKTISNIPAQPQKTTLRNDGFQDDRQKVQFLTKSQEDTSKKIAQYLNEKDDADEELNSYFRRLNNMVNEGFDLQAIMTDSQREKMLKSQNLLECYKKANSYRELRNLVIGTGGIRPVSENDLTPAPSKKSSVGKNQELNQRFNNSGSISGSKFGNRQSMPVENGQTRKLDAPFSQTAPLSSVFPGTTDEDLTTRKIAQFIETERSMLLSKIEMLVMENKRLEMENRRHQKQVSELEEKVKSDKLHMKSLEADLHKNQRLVDDFVKKLEKSVTKSMTERSSVDMHYDSRDSLGRYGKEHPIRDSDSSFHTRSVRPGEFEAAAAKLLYANDYMVPMTGVKDAKGSQNGTAEIRTAYTHPFTTHDPQTTNHTTMHEIDRFAHNFTADIDRLLKENTRLSNEVRTRNHTPGSLLSNGIVSDQLRRETYPSGNTNTAIVTSNTRSYAQATLPPSSPIIGAYPYRQLEPVNSQPTLNSVFRTEQKQPVMDFRKKGDVPVGIMKFKRS